MNRARSGKARSGSASSIRDDFSLSTNGIAIDSQPERKQIEFPSVSHFCVFSSEYAICARAHVCHDVCHIFLGDRLFNFPIELQ